MDNSAMRQPVEGGQVFKSNNRERWVVVYWVADGHAAVSPVDEQGNSTKGRISRIKVDPDGCGLANYTRHRPAEINRF